MFSVNNFYNFFHSTYGPYSTSNVIMTFQPHGSKDLHTLEPFGITPDNDPNFQNICMKNSRIVLHDQEPLFLNHIGTYRYMLSNCKNLLHSINDNQEQNIDRLKNFPDTLTDLEFLRKAIGGRNLPIICHSELNSQDTDKLSESGFIPCYYWWHGMIARDWYRHWHHYESLHPANKSHSKQRFLLYCRSTDGTRLYRTKLLDHCRQYKNLTRHNWDSPQVDSTYSAKIDISDAMPPVQIVAETLFDTDKIYLTEKVFKPMVMSQAFVLFAPPGSLQYLRDYGFKTFDCCWDESYDLEQDSAVRMSKLLCLISELASMPQEQFSDLYQRALPVIRHNRQRFFDMAFQDDLISEMRTNISTALLKQNQCH